MAREQLITVVERVCSLHLGLPLCGTAIEMVAGVVVELCLSYSSALRRRGELQEAFGCCRDVVGPVVPYRSSVLWAGWLAKPLFTGEGIRPTRCHQRPQL